MTYTDVLPATSSQLPLVPIPSLECALVAHHVHVILRKSSDDQLFCWPRHLARYNDRIEAELARELGTTVNSNFYMV